MSAASIIIPAFNEANEIDGALAALPDDTQVIVVDGGSTDNTAEIARRNGTTTLISDKGRATQMNAGARAADAEVLVFVHADTRLPKDFNECIRSFIASPQLWGRFDITLTGAHPAFRLIERMMNWRSRLTGICTGDQVIVVKRDAFDAIGGFPEIPLMEDIAISKRLKTMSRPWCCHSRVVSSSRRWERDGIARTVLMMWRMRLAYFSGVAPARLAQRYYG